MEGRLTEDVNQQAAVSMPQLQSGKPAFRRYKAGGVQSLSPLEDPPPEEPEPDEAGPPEEDPPEPDEPDPELPLDPEPEEAEELPPELELELEPEDECPRWEDADPAPLEEAEGAAASSTGASATNFSAPTEEAGT